MLISDQKKGDLKAQKVTSDKEGHYIMIRANSYQEDTAVLN